MFFALAHSLPSCACVDYALYFCYWFQFLEYINFFVPVRLNLIIAIIEQNVLEHHAFCNTLHTYLFVLLLLFGNFQSSQVTYRKSVLFFLFPHIPIVSKCVSSLH